MSPRRFLYLTAIVLAGFIGGCDKDDVQNNLASPTPATVIGKVPGSGATNVPINRKIAATFSQAMDSASLTTSSFTCAGPDATPIAATVSYDAVSKIALLSPSNALAVSTVYTVKVTSSVKDSEGHPLAGEITWSFTSGASADTTAPKVNSTFPANGALGVAINGTGTVVFDEAMDPASINATSLTVVDANATAVQGTVTYSGNTAFFKPTSNLASNTLYTVTVTTAVQDLAGNALTAAYTSTFTTGSTAALGPAPVALGTAGDYVLLAKSAISTTGTTAVVGNVGLSPSAQSFLTGFSESLDASNVFATAAVVVGKLFAADMAVPTPSNLTTAISNMETAYTDAAGRTLPDATELGAGDVSGMTLSPGLYKWGTALLMASDVTLSGSANDVWIFQIAQDLTVNNGVQVKLAGGALAKNIFWQVAGQATLGTTAVFNGIILGQTKIVLKTGASLNGRALAQTAVTLDANAVTQPAL